MADSRPEKFVYVHTRPTNVCFNGVSLPVLPGDVIKCYPEYIASFIPEKFYKKVPPGSKKDQQKVKHNIPRTPIFMRPDPTGGLPMKSNPNTPSRLKSKLQQGPVSPALVEEVLDDNPYDLGVDKEPTLEMGTALDVPSVPEPRMETLTTVPPSSRVETKEEVIPEDNQLEVEQVEEVVEQVEEVVEQVDTPEVPLKSSFRKLKRDELYDLAVAHGIDVPEDAPKGVIVDILWPIFYEE